MDTPVAEEWRPIEEAPGYQVSSLGRVMGRRGKPLTQTVNQFGYKTVSPYVGGKTLYRQAHRLVAQAFIPNPDGLPLVNHKGGDRLNNAVDNLEWVTAKQNAERIVKPAEASTRRSRKVVQTFPDGHTETWDSLKEAAEEAGVSPAKVSKHCRDGSADARGSRWAYLEDVVAGPEGERWGRAQGIEVSSHGRIRLFNGQIVVGRKRGSYLRYQSHGVHRLVAEAFCDRPQGADVVNHKNGNPTDNRADNLEWLTQRENCIHAAAAGLSRRYAVRRTMPNGATVDYPSIQEASRQTRISAGDITWACKGRRPRAGGSQWRYLDPPEGGQETQADAQETQADAQETQADAEETQSDAQETQADAEDPTAVAGTPDPECQGEQPKITDADLDALLAELGI